MRLINSSNETNFYSDRLIENNRINAIKTNFFDEVQCTCNKKLSVRITTLNVRVIILNVRVIIIEINCNTQTHFFNKNTKCKNIINLHNKLKKRYYLFTNNKSTKYLKLYIIKIF